MPLALGDHNVRFGAAAEASVGYGNPHQDEISEWQHDYREVVGFVETLFRFG